MTRGQQTSSRVDQWCDNFDRKIAMLSDAERKRFLAEQQDAWDAAYENFTSAIMQGRYAGDGNAFEYQIITSHIAKRRLALADKERTLEHA